MEYRGPTAAEEEDQGLVAEERFAITELKNMIFSLIYLYILSTSMCTYFRSNNNVVTDCPVE